MIFSLTYSQTEGDIKFTPFTLAAQRNYLEFNHPVTNCHRCAQMPLQPGGVNFTVKVRQEI